MVCVGVEWVLELTLQLSERMDKLLPSELIVTGGRCCTESICKSSLIRCSAFLSVKRGCLETGGGVGSASAPEECVV